MTAEEKGSVKNSVGRLIFALLSILIQVGWIMLVFMKLNNYSTEISLLSSLLALIVVLNIYEKNVNSAFKMPWMIIILALPVFGLCLYFLFGRGGLTVRVRKCFSQIEEKIEESLMQDEKVMKCMEEENFALANQSRYIWNCGKYPVYQNTDVEFYPEAIDALEAQKEELRKAEKFIFLEYHAIEDSMAFHGIKEILAQKVQEGVEVRMIYDDIGSIGFINKDFIGRMEKLGIQCRVFNPVVPFLNVFMNNRDHRKITVIDGKTGFTGGYNLAEEYFNFTHPYGYWKDTGIKITGDAVRSLSVMFLTMWNSIERTDADYENYLPEINYKAEEGGFLQPYADSPLDQEYLGENVYLNIIKNAKHELYFTTPYLVITDEMSRELGLAAKRGVDVRIITPGIPDKKIIYQVTRSYYAGLVKSGVRIYEFTPGFMHAKQCICDNETATVGTINMDFRSLYLHFENGVYLYGYKAVQAIKKDFEETFLLSEEVTEKYKDNKSNKFRGIHHILRLFSPLM